MSPQQDLEKYVNGLLQAVSETARSAAYASDMAALVHDMRVFGEGPDVSPEELVYTEIAWVMQFRFISRLSDLIGWLSQPEKTNAKYGENDPVDLNAAVPRSGKNSWSLKNLIPQIYVAGSSFFDEQQKEALEDSYRRYLKLACSEEFDQLLELRHKGVAHLDQDISLHDGTGVAALSKIDSFPKRLLCLQEATDIAYMIFAAIAPEVPAKLTGDLNEEHIIIKHGMIPMNSAYRHALQASQTPEMTRMSPPPSTSEALLTKQAVWQSASGTLWWAKKLAPRHWRVFSRISAGGVEAQAVVAETDTLKKAKEAALLAATSTGTRPATALRIHAVQYAEHIRNTRSADLEKARCVFAVMLVSTLEDSQNWDSYMGIDTPIEFVFAFTGILDTHSRDLLNSIAVDISDGLKQLGIPVSYRFSELEQIKQSLSISQSMLLDRDNGNYIQVLPCFGNTPAIWKSDCIILDSANTEVNSTTTKETDNEQIIS